MSMDEADFSEDMTYKQQEDLPYDGDLPRSKMCTDYNFTSKDAHWNVTNQILLIGDAPQEKATQETCRNRAAAMTLDKTTENAVNKKYDKEKHCAVTLRVIANEGDSSKTNISTVLHHHLSKERFLRGQGTDDKTLPKTLSSDSFEEAAIIENIISGYIQTPWPKEQSPAVTDQLNLKTDGESGKKPSCRITAEENIRDPKGPEVAGDSHHQENAAFLTQIKGPGDKPKNCPGQAPQKQETETATSGHGFQYGQGQVLYQLPDFSKVAPKVKMSKANSINRPFTLPKQPNFSPKLRYKPAIIHDILETMSRSNCAEKQHQEQKRKITEVSPQMQVNIRAVSSSPGPKEDRSGPSGRQERAETAVFSSRCAFCRRRLVEWKQKMEKKSHRRFNCGRFSAVIQEKALHPDSALRPSFCSESIAGLHSNKHEGGGSKSPRKPPKEFRYRYNSPGQNDISHSERSAFAQPRSASPCSRPKRICSQKVNSKSLPDEQEPTPGKKNVQSPTASSPAPASPSRPFQRCRISASKSLGDLNVAEQTESRILSAALDHALKTASVLKKTTDQMIKTITEDLAKAERWRNRLQY
ncbi:protein AKNAD1 isoform X3 [Oryctolagus cuniculus]|uniref:protein AKNAD1 isoform X3 n=1 Tax=Oryctolagus cuniculus TaxID=9986 RepID=UPI00387A5DE5